MASASNHLRAEDFAELGTRAPSDAEAHRAHLQTCVVCRRRRDEVVRLRELLAQTGARERFPRRDVVPSAMLRLRLRRHGVTSANELLEGVVALMRGLASLFSLSKTEDRLERRARRAEDEPYE